ncbi:MAG: histidinol dehydrogenase [Polyangiales bacterium]
MSALIPRYRLDDEADRTALEALRLCLQQGDLTRQQDPGADVSARARAILDEVRQGGDAAAARLVAALDGATFAPAALRVPEAELAAAHAHIDADFLALMRRAADNIRAYQQHIRHRDPEPLVRGGRRLGLRYRPIERVGVYVPGGRALYPSSVLMTVVPAQVAGVPQIVMASPPTGGDLDPMVKALAYELGVREVYRLGGAVAVAALAFGTGSIPPVHKIVGPGNAYVAEAKRQVLGQVGIDMIAGPSEVLIIADDSAPPDWIAADLLAQAEHDPGSAILVSDAPALLDAVAAALAQQWPQCQRKDAIAASLRHHSALVVARDLDAACTLANRFAPEHLQLMTRDNARYMDRLQHAGALFLGQHTPVPVGDYLAGPSHTLPTGGTARFFGPLSANDFLKATSTLEYDAAAIAEDATAIADFAGREGLDAHARSALCRL